MVVDKERRREEAGGGGRRREEAGKRPGIQNQKQEPHTKLWGITLHRVIPTLANYIQKEGRREGGKERRREGEKEGRRGGGKERRRQGVSK